MELGKVRLGIGDLVETVRRSDGWAARCLWRESGDIRGLIYPPRAAVIEEGLLPSGRQFTLLRGDGDAEGSVTTLEDDAHFCIEPVGTRGEVEGDL